jgi:hypothetical protein
VRWPHMQDIRPCGSDWCHPVTRARRLRSRGTRAKTLALAFALAAIALVLLLALPSPAEDEQRERIPGGCRELADRGGLPLTLTHTEAARAIAYLSLMSGRDPAVLRCRAAILRR